MTVPSEQEVYRELITAISLNMQLIRAQDNLLAVLTERVSAQNHLLEQLVAAQLEMTHLLLDKTDHLVN